MLRFAFRNLLTMRVRTLLAVVGLSIGVTGVVTLWAVSMGLRAMVSATLQKVEGLGVVQKDIFNPMHSVLPTRLAREIEKIPGVRTVVPEIWKPQLRLEGQLVHRGVRLPGVVLLGIDLDQSAKMERGALYRRTIQEGRFLDPSDKDKKVLLLSKKVAGSFEKEVGDTFSVADEDFTIVGIYDTGSLILDLNVIMAIEHVRRISAFSPKRVSAFYVEVDDPRSLPQVEKAIEEKLPMVDALNVVEWNTEFDNILIRIDGFLLIVAWISVLVAVVGIVNTMLMSVTERMSEIGILKANGWTRRDVLRLILYESGLLGMLGGFLGCAAGFFLVKLFSVVLLVEPITPFWLLGVSFLLASICGIGGGLYPAYRAATMNPIDAIRIG